MAADASEAPPTACFNPWGAALPESVQFIVFDFVVPGRRTYDARGRRVLRDTMNDTSETLCDDRVESSPLWDLKLHATGRAWRAARATGKAFYEDFASVAVARAAANLQMGDYVAAISGLASLAGALPPQGLRAPGTQAGTGPTQQLPPPFYLALASDETCSELLATAAGARLAVRGRDPKVRLPAARALDEARAALQKAASGSAFRYFGLALATFGRHAEAAAALEKALADPMIAASSSAEALAADAAAQRALAAEAGTRQVTLVPSGPWVEGVFGASRVVSINGDAPLGDLLGGVDEAARLRLIDSEGRALNREWTPAAACVYDGVTLLVAENDRRNLRQRRPDTYQTPAEAAQRRGSVLDAIRRRVTPTAPLDPAYVIDARDEATLYQNARAGRAAARAIRGNRAAWDTYIRRRAAPADGPGGIPVTDAVPGNQAADDAS